MQNEIWKDIEGYVGLYQVSNLGRIKSLANRSNHKDEVILKPATVQGYKKVNLYKNSNGKIYPVHRLVATAFISNEFNKEEVNHIDGNKNNNCVENLEWNTKKENQIHCVKTGLRIMPKGINSKLSKKVAKIDIQNGKIIEIYNSYREAERMTGIAHSNIKRCVTGKYKQVGGFKWKEI